MTTELTLREKVLAVVADCEADDAQVIDRIADLLSATGAPAYIRVADDLRGVVRGEPFDPAEYVAARHWKDDLDQLSESDLEDLRAKMISRGAVR